MTGRSLLLLPAVALGVALGAGRGPVAADPAKEGRGAAATTAKVEGTLTEARCYFTTGAVGGRHQYCAFMSMKANPPVGVLTARGEFVYLAIEPRRLARWASRPVRAEGEVLPGGRLMKPTKIWAQTDAGWTLIAD